MPQTDTGDETCRDLSPEQEAALQSLLAGASDQAAALLAGTSRSSIVRWRKLDVFKEALAEARRAQRDAFGLRLGAVIDRALDVVSRAVDSGDLKAALAILQSSGVLSASAAEPERPVVGLAPARERLAALIELQYRNLQAAAAEDALVSDD